MNHNVKSYLEELQQRSLTIAAAKSVIEKETKKFEETIAPQKEIIEKQQLEIDHIRSTEAKAKLKDIINEVAKDWNTDPSNISTKCFSFFTHTPSAEKRIYNGVKDLSGYYVLNFSLSCKNGATHYTAFSTRMSSNTPQSDGSPISKYLAFSGHGTQGSKAKILTQEEINNIVLSFKISDFIDPTNKVKDTGCGQALYNACETFSKKHSIKTM